MAHDYNKCDCIDCIAFKRLMQIQSLEARVKELEEAMRPFADAWQNGSRGFNIVSIPEIRTDAFESAHQVLSNKKIDKVVRGGMRMTYPNHDKEIPPSTDLRPKGKQ